MRLQAIICLLIGSPGLLAEDNRLIRIVPSRTLPAFESVSIYTSATFKTGKDKPKPLAERKFERGFGDLLVAVDAEAVHVFVKPKDGAEVQIASSLTVKPGQTSVLKLADLLGVIDVTQKDGFPRVDRIVLTAPGDPGPDEKGHVAVQIGSDYRVEMPVPEGFYAVWLVPANGARALRIEDKTRVLPGKIVRIGN